MQLSESLLILFIAVNLFYFIFGKKPDKRWAIASLVLLLIHFLLGEARWQVSPVYLLAFIIILSHFLPLKASKWLRVPACIFGLLLTLLSGVFCYALPVFNLPAPSGLYAVASHSLYLKDSSRKEDITPEPDDLRELMMNVWYPVNHPEGRTKPYLERVERKGFAMKYGLPASAFHYLNGVKTHLYEEFLPAEGSFPVLIFSPGYYTPTSGYHSILADLVSHGFIIFSLNHSHETMGSEMPDGREIFFDQNYANQHNWSEAMGKAVELFNNAPEDEKHEAIKAVCVANEGATRSVIRWSADIHAALDAITEWNTDPEHPLAGKMKLEQIGVLGHSRGGASAIEASIDDPRIKAAANLDGAQWGSVIHSKLNKPTAVFSSANSLPYDVNQYIFMEAKGANFYDVVLAHSGHSNFSDIPYMVRIPQLNEAGSIDPKVASTSVNAFLRAFFEKHLTGKASDLDAVVSNDENLKWKE